MIQTISVIEAVEVSFAFLANRIHPWFHRSPSVGHCLLASQHVLEKVEGLRPPPPVSTANEAEAITISINSQFSTNRAKMLEADNYPEFQTARGGVAIYREKAWRNLVQMFLICQTFDTTRTRGYQIGRVRTEANTILKTYILEIWLTK